jgi:dCTP deaminase
MERPREHQEGRSLLSRDKILEHHQLGNIVISPFDILKLNTVSYDVSLGENFYRPNKNYKYKYYNPWNRLHVEDMWIREHASKAGDVMDKPTEEGYYPDDLVIVLNPHELLLCHTDEFIGGRNNVTANMHARSSSMRSAFSVCMCAGWGDVGYINRWTMEIKHHFDSVQAPIILGVGRRVAQMEFEEVAPITGQQYANGGKYQHTDDFWLLMQDWKPEDMLPKMWKDREVRK